MNPVERRKQETLARCKSPAQRSRVEALHAEGKTAYPEKRMGKSVIAEARRFMETSDPEKVGEGLYAFSMYVLSSIAHYNLGGFRGVYYHPALWIDRLLVPDARKVAMVEGHSVHVFKDGMTGGEVLDEMLRLAAQHRERLVTEFNDGQRSAALAEATRLADRLGMKLVAA